MTAYADAIVFQGLIGFCSLVLLLLFVLFLLQRSESSAYRKLLADLYVAGTIRKFAKEDSIDLDVEEVKLKSWIKKGNIVDKDLDRAIEEELKDRITESNTKKLIKDKK